MATATLISMSEYLQNTYEPDCEWVEGELRERSMPGLSHASVQMFFSVFFSARKRVYGTRVYSELRMRVNPRSIRIPDVTVMWDSDPADEIVVAPPLLCIEVLSPEDRMSEIQEKVDEYLDMGVRSVWVIDPRRQKGNYLVD